MLLALLALALAADPLTQVVRNRYYQAKENLVATAEMMPEQDYSFRLSPPQRTFGEWIGHTAMSMYGFCATIRGAAQPDTRRLDDLKTKPDLVKALHEALAYCDESFGGMTDQKALTEVNIGTRRVAPVQGMVGLIASLNEHYGNLVGYLRVKGLTPPSSARPVKIPEKK